MNHNQTYRFWRSAAQCLLGGIAVALVTFVCFRLNVSITTAALLYLIVVVLASLTGSFVLSAVVSIIAILCLDYFFSEPLFRIDIALSQPLNAVVLITFLTTALVITSLMSKVRKSFQETQALKDQLRLVIDTIPALVWSVLPDGSVDFLNQRWLEYTGLSLEDGLGQGWQAAIHPEDRARFVDEWRAALAAGEPLEAETRLRRADGESRWFLLRAVPLRDEKGNIVKWYGTSTDIEDRKQAEEIRTAQARQAGVRADVSAALSKPAHSGEILRGSAEAIVRHLDAAFARIWTLNKEKNMLELQASAGMYTHLDGPHSRIQVGKQKIGLIAQEKKPHLTNDVLNDPRVSDKAWAQNEGMVSFAGYPLIVQDRVVGVMAMFARQRLSAATLDTLASVADSIAQGIERKQTEEKIRQSEAYLAEAQRLSHTGSFGLSVSNGEIFWSEETFRIFERDRAVKPTLELVLQRVHPEDIALVQQTLDRASHDGKDFDFENRFLMPDGSVKYVHVVAHAVKDESGKLEFVGAVMDITERKQAEEVLREQARLLDLTHDTVFVRDLNDVITYWNRGAEELYGWTREETVGKVSHQLTQTIFPAPLEEINAELLRTGRWDGELVHTKRDGTQVIVASRWSMQRDERGRLVGTLETNNDITERKRAEEALRKARTELAHVTRVMTMGELTASIAHEINQPLSGIVTNASACRRWLAGATPNLDEARDAVVRILRDGNRASDVITRIRALVRKADEEKDQLDMNHAIQEVAALTQGEVGRNRVALRMELAADVPPVLGDRVQLQQVILNLVMNGVEAMASVADRPRELLIRSRQHESDRVLVAVQDSGIGIDGENLEKIFNSFYTTKSQGMGMGLAISRSIIENHGGFLWAIPNDGPGTTFQFTLLKYHQQADE
jgi:two-component system sensor kinase FixL